MSKLRWQSKPFEALSLNELYQILALRQQVFVVEQNCPYQDADGEDHLALHLMGFTEDTLVAYARVFPVQAQVSAAAPLAHGASSDAHRIGRVIVAPQVRGEQLGRQLMQRALDIAFGANATTDIVVGAQTYLLDFYHSLGFVNEGAGYLEDGIPHQDMRLSATAASTQSPFSSGKASQAEETGEAVAQAPAPALIAGDPELAPAAVHLAQELQLPEGPNEHPFVLELTQEGLQLRWQSQPKVTPLLLDFVTGKQAWRRQAGPLRDEAIVRALGIQKGHRPDVLDATAGLGRDGMILAHAGCSVRFLERNPAIHALLSDAIYRAGQDSHIGHWVSERVRVLPAGSILQPAYAAQLMTKPPMAIYLDPMFPHRDKSAAVKKDMQMLQELVGSDGDSEGLLDAALGLASHRVVVKRPIKAPYLAQREPHAQITTKKHRFDIYIKQAY